MKTGDSAVWLTNLKKIDLNNTVCTYAGRTKFKFAFNEWRNFYKEIKGGETFYKCDENTTYYVFTTIESLNRYIETLDIINKVNDLCKERSFYWSLEDAHEIFGLLKKNRQKVNKMNKIDSKLYCRDVKVIFSLGLYLKKHHFGITIYDDMIRVMLGRFHYIFFFKRNGKI